MTTSLELRGCRRRGTTLVEVLLSVLIIGILAVAGVSYMAHAGAESGRQRLRRVALEVADGRMEDLRGAKYDHVKPTAHDYNLRYLRKSGASWLQSSSNPAETTNVNHHVYPITTTVRYLDIDGGTSTYDYVQVTVTVGSATEIAGQIILESTRAPL